MANILVVGDLHLSDRPPANCTESYQDDLFDLLYQIVEVARQHNCAAVVQAGDFFHSKIPGRTSHRTVARALDWVKQVPCPLFVVVGNHDISHDRVESLDEGQPLGVVLRGGAHLLSGWADLADDAVADLRVPLYGVPWLQTWNDRDPEVGGPSNAAKDAVTRALADWHSRWDGSVPALCVTHAPFYPPGLELEFEHYPTSLFGGALEPHGAGKASVYYGHVHEAHGEYVAGGARFCNYGAVSRGSIAEHDLTRELAVALWDSTTGRFTRVPLTHRPAGEVFRLTEVAQVQQRQLDLDAFLAGIGESSLEITSTAAVLEHVRSLGLAPDVVALIEELLEGARV